MKMVRLLRVMFLVAGVLAVVAAGHPGPFDIWIPGL